MNTHKARFSLLAVLILMVLCLPGLSTIPVKSDMPVAGSSLNQPVSRVNADPEYFDTKAPLTGTWSALTSGTGNNLFSVHFVNDNEGWAVGAGNTILHTTNGGASWAAQTNQGGVPPSSYLGVRFINSSIGWAGGGSAVLRTTDGGSSWVDQGAVQDGRFRNNLFAVSSTVAWVPAQGGGFRWFTRVTSGVGEADFNVIFSSAQYFDICFTDTNNGWSVGTGPIVKISNASSVTPTFGFQTTCPCPTLNGIHMLNSTTGWAVGNGGLILKTTNGGSTWPAQTSGTITNLRSVHFVDANTGWAVGAGGLILMSTDGGTSWTQETSGVATELRRVFFTNAFVGYAAGIGGTILKRTDAPVPQTFIVTNTNDSGPGSLRQAILNANANPETDTIVFNIPTSDPNFDGTAFYVRPTSGQLVLTNNGTFIDGSTQAAFSGDTNPNGPEIVIDDSSNSCGAANCSGLKIQSSNNRIHHLVVNQVFDVGGTGTANGIAISAGGTGNTITGCYIGTDVSGTSQVFVDGHGVSSAGGNTIGGLAAGEGNLISGCGTTGFGGLQLGSGDIVRGNKIGTNASGTSAIGNSFYGITIASGSGTIIEGNLISGNFGSGIVLSGSGVTGNFIRGNKIGTEITGTSALGNNGDGIEISGAISNTVGGTTPTDRNVLSGNALSGVQITGATATGNIVLGNYIGTNITGTAAVRNNVGVSIQDAPGNTIGGTTAGARNIISGHNTQNGVGIGGPAATGNVIQGNYIGTDVTGTIALGNLLGLVIAGPNNTIGGTAPGAGNVISGNTRGMDMTLASGNVVQGNFIGTNPSGTAALSNALSGVFVAAPNNIIGGAAAGARNIISGNGLNGVEITNATGPKLPPSGNVVIGNYIGTDVTGTLDLGNAQDGVNLYAAPGNTIGGTTSAERNLISGNNRHGVYIEGNSLGSGDGNIVRGNYIGTKLDGVSPLPNSETGVLIRGNNGTVNNNIIGGTATGAGNTIAYNGAGGVSVSATFGPSIGNAILSNSITSNTGLGIDLEPSGVTPNDAGDADTGVNNLQNFPALTSVTFSGGNTTILGTLHSTANTLFRVEFFSSSSCDSSGHGEGAVFLGAVNVTTDSSGVSSFSATFAVVIPAGQVITATATDAANNTSEFSTCLTVPLITLSPPTLPAGTTGSAYNQTITASGGTGPYTFAKSSGSLPAGLTLSSGGSLTGTPTGGGSFTFTVKATDAASMTGTRSYTLAIAIPNPCPSAGFDPQTLYATGARPEFVVTTDFNHDGRLDLAVANADSASVSILLGTGPGTFGPAVHIGVGSSPQSIGVGDFNGDTHPDLAVPNRGSNDISILLGNGTGGFGAATNFGSLVQPEYVAVGDFNSDGKLDLAAANFGSNNVSILLGNGAGAFGATSNFDSGAGQQSVVVGDFNSDGALDLVVSHNSVNTVSVLLGNGVGGFNAPTSLPVGFNPWSLATGDFNEDGKSDLVVGKFQGTVAVLLGDGGGSFSPYVDYVTGEAPLNIAVGDLNGDGHPDLAVSNSNTSFISILTGNGAGGFGSATNTTVGIGPSGIATGDFDGDGRSDLAVARLINNDVAILLKTCCPVITLTPPSLPAGTVGVAYNQTINASGGTPAYTFVVAAGGLPAGLTLSGGGAISGTPVVAGSFTFTVKATDAGGCRGTRSYTIAVASPAPCSSASFIGPTNFAAGSQPASVAVGDFNADTKLDLALANFGSSANTVSVLLGNGNGSFGAATSFGAGTKPRSVAAGDFNNDNKLDLAVANVDSNNVSVLLGNGLGGFGAATDFAVETAPIDVKLADFNRDGNLDIAVANASSGTVSILIGNGAGGFAAAASFGGAANAGGIAVGDFNGDGRLDIAAASQSPARVAIMLGNGTGGLGGPMTFSIGAHPSYVATADFNNDGRLDLAVTDLELSRVSVLAGDGAGGFGSQVDFPVGTFPSYIAVSDFSGDGRADLAVANLTSHNVSVLTNNGAGGFGAALTLGAGTNPRGIAAGDFNGDGKFDFAVANASDNVSIFRSNCGCAVITLSPPTLPSGTVDAAYNQTIIGSGGSAPYTFALTSGALPPGLTLSTSGALTGTPTTAGDSNFTVTAADANGCEGSRSYTLRICPVITLSPATLPNGGVGTSYNRTITASGGSPAYTFAVTSGALPPTLSLSSAGVISGTLTTLGSYGFTVTATDTNGCTGSRSYTITVCPAITVSPATLSAGTVGVAYNQMFAASGGTSPYSFAVAVGALPVGLSLSSNGAITGTPALAGGYTFSVSATDANGCRGSRSYTISIAAAFPCSAPGFAQTNFPADGNPFSIAVSDFNLDNKADLAVANQSSGNVSILLGNGAGAFGAPTNFALGTNPTGVAASDFNLDGKPDLAVEVSGSAKVSILLGDGLGSFGAPTDFSVGSGPISLAISDFNQDGKPDFATANISSNNISIRLGNGTGGFGALMNFPVGNSPRSIAVGDFNGDGKPDAVVANESDNNISVLLGDGEGSLGAATSFAAGNIPRFVAVADFNLDGKADIAVSNTNSNSVSIRLGDGAGSFGAATDFATGTTPIPIAAGDFNVDGKPDLAVANANGHDLAILLGNGAGAFNAPVSFPITSFNALFIAVGDFNLDHRPDVAVANINSESVAVFLNTCCPTIIVSPPSLPGGTVGTAYNQTITATGSTPPYTFAVTTGALPDGLTLSSGGVISGTPTAAGKFPFTVTATDSNGCSGSASYSITIDFIPAALTVTKTADTNDGSCTLGDCSLREAINAANVNPDSNTISFNVPTSDPGFAGGVFTIRPTSSLPSITNPATIDGATQTAFSGNTNANGPEMVLNGSLTSGANGITISASNSIFKDIVVNGFANGIAIGSAVTTGNQILNNYVGTDASGTTAVPNQSAGVSVATTSGSTVSGNLISGNGGIGVVTCDVSGTTFSNNLIGTDRTGLNNLGNGGGGMNTFCTIFTNNTIQGNTFGFNGGDGFRDQPDYGGNFLTGHINNRITQNSFFSNAGLGINLLPPPNNTIDGVTPNDAGDGDGGANHLQNFPVISSAATNGTQINIQGSLNSTANIAFSLEFHTSSSCDASGNGEGQSYIGSVMVTTDGASNASFAVSFVASIAAGQTITATAIDPAGNTSEFSACSQATAGSTIPAGSYSTVTIASGTTLTLSGNVTITGQLTLNGELNTGGFTLTMPAGTTTSGNGDVIGSVRRTGFVIGTALSFGNPFNTIQFDSGAPPTEVTVNLVKSPPIGFPNAVERTYTITPVGGSGYNATLQLHYLDSELNGNSEATLEFWRHNGTVWAGQGATTRDATDNWVRLTGVTEFSPWVMSGPGGPSAIQLVSFTATAYDTGVFIEWRTGLETDHLGFNIYRDRGGKRSLVNNQLVAGSALRDGAALRAGESYAWWDNGIADCGLGIADCRNATYWLEDLDLKGASAWHGPFVAKQVGGAPPARSNAALISKLGSAQAQADSTRVVGTAASQSTGSSAQASAQSALASLAAVKIAVKREGWYRVTQPELVAAGVNPKTDPRGLQLFLDGREVPIYVLTGKSGEFDASSAIEFYGVGLDTPSTDARIYWLIASAQDGKRIGQFKTAGTASSAPSFTQTVERKDRTIYFSALRNGDKENFFGAVVAGAGTDQTVSLIHLSRLDSSNFETILEVALRGVTETSHRVLVQVNSVGVREISFNEQQQGFARFNINHALLREGDNAVRLTPQNGASDISLVDHIRISYQHTFTADDDALRFTATSGQQVTIDGFSSRAIRVFDVTDASNVQELIGEASQSKAGFAVAVAPHEPGLRTLIAVADEKANNAASVEANKPSGWRSPANSADFVIITASDLPAALQPLRDLRQSEGYKVALIDVEDIYDEFNFGHKSPQAIRDLLAYAASSWKLAPRFVLFAGDASFDPKNYLGLGYNDLVPTRLLDTNFLETASDDWFADFNSDGVAEMAVGRLPIRGVEEAATVVSKLISYSQSKPFQSVALVSDANDGFNFERASSQLRPLFPPTLKLEEIKRGEFEPATAKARLVEAISRGQKLINYIGHGSANQWRGDLLTSADASALTNGDRLPVFVMMTCLNGYFHNAALDSLGESLIKAEHGGAIAVWASSGMTFPEQQVLINQQFYRSLFATNGVGKDAAAVTLGEAIQRAKSAGVDADIRRTWILLGDPTMRLR